MGGQREYIPSGGFSNYLYETHTSYEPITINGVRCKVVHFIADGGKNHTGLPTFSNTSDMYLRVGEDGSVIQAKLYVNRRQSIDFDWGHMHVNRNGDCQVFPKGVVHVQEYVTRSDGSTHRLSNEARLMSDEEIEKFGPIFRHFNPNVRFRP